MKAVLWILGYISVYHQANNYFSSQEKHRVVVTNHLALTGFWVFSVLDGYILSSAESSIYKLLGRKLPSSLSPTTASVDKTSVLSTSAWHSLL